MIPTREILEFAGFGKNPYDYNLLVTWFVILEIAACEFANTSISSA